MRLIVLSTALIHSIHAWSAYSQTDFALVTELTNRLRKNEELTREDVDTSAAIFARLTANTALDHSLLFDSDLLHDASRKVSGPLDLEPGSNDWDFLQRLQLMKPLAQASLRGLELNLESMTRLLPHTQGLGENQRDLLPKRTLRIAQALCITMAETLELWNDIALKARALTQNQSASPLPPQPDLSNISEQSHALHELADQLLAPYPQSRYCKLFKDPNPQPKLPHQYLN